MSRSNVDNLRSNPDWAAKSGLSRRRFASNLTPEVYNHLRPKALQAITRCTDSGHKHWQHYGGRGIKVYEEWVDDPLKFIEYLASLPGCLDKSLVLDRQDNESDYKPGNLRFVTRGESRRNQRLLARTAGKERSFVELNYTCLSVKREPLSQRQFAATIGVSHRRISLIERGITYGTGSEMLVRILKAYDVFIE